MATNFFSRWSKRKLDQSDSVESEQSLEIQQVKEKDSAVEQRESYSDEAQTSDTSPDNLNTIYVEEVPEAEANLGSLLASDTEQHLKKMAMRKLFMSEFNQVDALNDYDHDYSQVKSLSSEIAGQLRDWVKQVDENESEKDQVGEDEAKKLIEKQDAPLDEDESEETTQIVRQNIPHEK